ncbi:MAG: hypothetical protein M1412_06965 [Deltaproteobacteria bacterium]|nr:hypothetical protein [Deltaproteobacteria bacterium]MCL5892883.1 hypothetical protein [Deltaproteobacteria bacterium]
MKTSYFKIYDFDLSREYNNYFWDRALCLPKLISQNLLNSISGQYRENYQTREDDLNIKLFHIFYVLKKYVDAGFLSFPKDIWIGMRQYSTKFKNRRSDLGYISGDFDFLVGGLTDTTFQTDNIIGIETKKFPYDSCHFDEDYANMSQIPGFKLKEPRKDAKRDGAIYGLNQIVSYKYFFNKVILFYICVARPIPTCNVIPQAYNGDIIRKTIGLLKDKYKDKFTCIPDDVGFCISGIAQVPGKDSLDSGMPVTPEIIKNPLKHEYLLPDRKDFIGEIKDRLDNAKILSCN